ncbi:MAG: hypothetical protein EBT09_08485, partial [Actinobacteria bacterium]|nr:hypothetical protein [Actinomycetota bacterium]
MAVERSFLVKLLADPKELFKAFQQIQDKAKDSLGEADKEALKLSASFNKIAVASTAAFAGTAALISSATKAAIEDEAEQARLAKTLSTVAGATKETIAETEAFIAAQMRSTTFTDSEMRPALEGLVRSSGNVAEAQKQLKLAMDISTQTGVPLVEVSQALARANNDNFKSLKALSPALADNIKEGQSLDKIFAELTQTFGGAATAAGQTTAGQMQILSNTVAETKEAVGAAFIPVLQAVLGPLQAFAELAQRNSTLIAGIAAAVLTFTGIMIALSVALKAYTVAQTLATLATTRFGVAMSATGVGAVIVGIAALVALLVTLRLKMSAVSDEVDRAGQLTSEMGMAFNNFNGVSSVAGQRVIFLTNQTLILNSALSTSTNLINTQVNRLEGLAKSYGVTTFTTGKFSDATKGAGGAVKEAIKPAQEYAKVLKAAQAASTGFVQSQRAVRDSRIGLADADAALADAQSALLKAQQAGSPAEIADAQRAVAAAERGVARAKFSQEEAVIAVRDAERKLAEIRKDPESTPDEIRRAEIDLAEAKFRVKDVEDEQITTATRLSEARRNLRIATDGLIEGDKELLPLQDAVKQAQRQQLAASEAYTDALANETEALNNYKAALDELATAIINFPRVAANQGSPGLVPIVPTPTGSSAAAAAATGGATTINVTVDSSVVNPQQVGQ